MAATGRSIAVWGAGLVLLLARAVAGQDASPGETVTPPAQPSITVPAAVPKREPLTFDQFVAQAIVQERRLITLLRNFRPVIETYVQEQKRDPAARMVPNGDHYFLSRLDLTRGEKALSFEEEERPGRGIRHWFRRPARDRFAAGGFVQALFPDLEHFDRANYSFEYVRFENLGDVRCVVVDVKPRPGTENRGFMGRIWLEDQNASIVRFTGAYTSQAFAMRAFHFDSWRVNTLDVRWMPAYVYTEEWNPEPTVHELWFKAQTRVWGYDLANAGDHREFAKPLTDSPALVDPRRQEASQNLNPEYTVGKSAYSTDDQLVERLQVAGLMAPDGNVNKILETVVNNILLTNDLEIPAIRCRVLLTTPLESFVVGRTIIVSRGLLDVLPDEATLAAVLAHELAHIVLHQSDRGEYLSALSSPFSDLEIFSHLDFHFDPEQETEADRKGLELFAKSPYKDQMANAGLFLAVLEARSAQLPNLLRGRFSNDFGSSHLIGMQGLASSGAPLRMDRLDQIAALPLGSRIALNPWSDQIEMLKAKPVQLESSAEKLPFEVTPFFPHLKRLDVEKQTSEIRR
ncbi:MAG TPA: M48 family metalloprotease [Candidatus Sulfotelmatobacter sp.]|nr:M48 family metalloprotease [Candidatus Sulfotelmatobacter sp.]